MHELEGLHSADAPRALERGGQQEQLRASECRSSIRPLKAWDEGSPYLAPDKDIPEQSAKRRWQRSTVGSSGTDRAAVDKSLTTVRPRFHAVSASSNAMQIYTRAGAVAALV